MNEQETHFHTKDLCQQSLSNYQTVTLSPLALAFSQVVYLEKHFQVRKAIKKIIFKRNSFRFKNSI